MDWPTVVSNIGISGVLVAAVTWIVKSLASQSLAQQLESFKADLSAANEQHRQNYTAKIELYKQVADPIAALLATGQFTPAEYQTFEEARLKTYALLGMFAPLSVIHSYDLFMDYVLDCVDQKETYEFSRMRTLAYEFLTEVRKDIGLYEDVLSYSGHR